MNINSYVTAAQGVSLKSEPRPSTLPYLIASDNKLLWHNISDQAHFQSLVDAARSRRGRWEGNGWQFRNASGCAAVLDHALELGFDNVYSSTDDYKAADDAAGQAIAQRSPELKVKAVCRGIWMVSQTPATDSMRSVLERAHCRVIVKGETSTLLCVVDTRAARSILKSAKAQGFRVALDGRCSAGERHAVHVTTKGWIVQVSIPIEAAPWAASLCLAPCTRVVDWPKVSYVCPQTQINDGYAIVEIPCAEWENLGARIICLGFTVKGDEPELAIPDTDSQASNFKHMPQGWESEAPNGYRLFQYQKAGVAFAASRQYRCLISDEMGVGKTAQAIACAQAAGARRVLIVVPANARYVWEREIRGWTGDDAPIQHLRSSLDCITLADGWLIATYDQLAARKETWNCADADEELEMLAWLKGADLFDSGLFEEDKEILSSSQIALIRTANQKLKIKIPDRAATLSTTPVLSEQRLQMWNFKMERLRGAIVVGIETWAPDMTIIDEAHRVKNPHAKRTKSLRRIAPNSQAVILLTGTPVRNNAFRRFAFTLSPPGIPRSCNARRALPPRLP